MEFMWTAHGGLDAEAALAELPPQLRYEVLAVLQRGVVQQAALFKHVDPGLVKAGARLPILPGLSPPGVRPSFSHAAYRTHPPSRPQS